MVSGSNSSGTRAGLKLQPQGKMYSHPFYPTAPPAPHFPHSSIKQPIHTLRGVDALYVVARQLSQGS